MEISVLNTVDDNNNIIIKERSETKCKKSKNNRKVVNKIGTKFGFQSTNAHTSHAQNENNSKMYKTKIEIHHHFSYHRNFYNLKNRHHSAFCICINVCICIYVCSLVNFIQTSRICDVHDVHDVRCAMYTRLHLILNAIKMR